MLLFEYHYLRQRSNMLFSTEILGYIAAFCTTVAFLPQAILTIRTNDTESLSFGMYGLFTVGVLLWLIYGIQKHDSALIWANSITLILATTILSVKIKNTLKKYLALKKL